MRRLALILLLGACADFDLPGTYANYSPLAPEPIEVVMPRTAPRISQQFSPRQQGEHYSHEGLDVWAPRGTPIIAAAPGVVVASYIEPMHGNQVVIDHGIDADGMRVLTRYHHLSRRDVTPGQRVARGEPLGVIGAVGASALMVHLHFEVRRGVNRPKAKPLDPNLFWVDGPGRVTCFEPRQAVAALPVRFTYPVPCA